MYDQVGAGILVSEFLLGLDHFSAHLMHRKINSHRFNITHKRTEESPVAEHFNDEGHTIVDMTVVVIDQLYSHDPCLCKIRESRWIKTLGTSHPKK